MVLRYERPANGDDHKPDKAIRQARRVSRGWVLNLDGVERVLFNLTQVQAASRDIPVFVPEGEECVLALKHLGLVATCNSGGALKWHLTPGASEALRDRHVILLPDNDGSNEKTPSESYKGQRHAAEIAQALDGIAASVRVLELPGLPIKGDVVDWLKAGGTKEALLRLVEYAPKATDWSPPGVDTEPSGDLNVGTGTGATPVEWNEPEPLPYDLPPVGSFDEAMLPEALRPWLRDMADRMSLPLDYFAAPALVVAGALVGRSVGIHPKRHDPWLVVPNLWGALVAPPGMMKSAVLGEVLKPLERLAHDEAKDQVSRAAQYEADKMRAAALKAALQDQMKIAAKQHADAELDRLTQEAATIDVEESKQRRFKVNDGTVEKIGMLLTDNPRGLLVSRDELTGWLKNLDKAGHEGDRAFYLEAWNGTGSYDVDRVGRGSLHIPALCLSVLGGIQPGPLAHYIYDAASDGAGNDGLLQRFQLLVWPDPPRAYQHVDRWADTEAKNRANNILAKLASLTAEKCGAVRDDGDPESIPTLRFSESAQMIFDDFYISLQVRLRSGEMTGPMAAHLSKYASLMPSLALIFHLMDLFDGRANVGAGVSDEATARAIAWCEYLETHARRLYASAIDPNMERARVLLRHLKAGDIADGCTTRDIYRHHWERLASPEEVEAAVTVLELYGWVCLEPQKGITGRPPKVVRLHPHYRRNDAET